MTGDATDDEIRELIEEKAKQHEVPPDLLFEIYEAEKEVVDMKRRGSILKDVRRLLEKHAEAGERES